MSQSSTTNYEKADMDGKSESTTSDRDFNFEGKTMRYVDWRILPILSMLYSFAMIDRINLGAAYTAGMGADLKLAQGARFNLVICVFFIPYILFQLPGNLLLRKVGVRNWLTFIVVAWGAVQLGMGFVDGWQWLILCRTLLGTFEASFLPAVLFIMTTWYKRDEVQIRLAIFSFFTILAGGLSPLLAYGCSRLNGKADLAGWRWIFVVEGLITLSLSILTWYYIPDFPDQNTFLDSRQTALVLRRIDEDRGDAVPDLVSPEKVLRHLSDWTIWAYGMMFACATMPVYSMSYFLPIILREMGWTATQALLLSAPPYFLAVVSIFVAYWADRYRHRGIFILLTALVCMTGISLLAFAEQHGVRYFGAFLTSLGNSGCIPTVFAYAANNVVSHSKRSVQTAMQVSLGGIGAIIGTVVYRAQDAPRYIPGLATTIGSQVLLLIVLLATTIHFMRLNKQMREGKCEEPLEGQPGFYYTL